MGRDDRPRWDDGQLMGLAVEVLDDEEACGDEHPTSAAQDRRLAELSLADVVAAGQAAYCWLDVIVSLRQVTRRHGPDAGASTDGEPGH